MKINIIGAGISGLALGYFCKKKGHDVHIFEASNKAGGLIATEFVSEGIIQHGPHLTRLTNTLEVLLQELGIETIYSLTNKRYIASVCDGFSLGFPLTLSDILKSILLQFKKRKQSYTSVADFTNHHYGIAFTNNLLQPIINGIYAVPAEELNEEIALKNIYFKEKRAVYFTLKVLLQKLNSKSREIVTPKDGFQDLIEELAYTLNTNITYNTKIDDISNLNGVNYITVPAFDAKNINGILPDTHQILKDIHYSNLDVTTVFSSTPFKKEGIGILTNSQNGILGVLFNSSTFGFRTTSRLHSYSIFSKNFTEEEVKNFCKNTLKVEVTKSYFKSYSKAVPIYNNTVKDFIEHNDSLKTNYKFFSNYTGDISIGAIIEKAKGIAEKL
jgi:protoporphyrinogen oxidase